MQENKFWISIFLSVNEDTEKFNFLKIKIQFL